MNPDPTPTLPYFRQMESGTARAHCALVVPVDDAVTTEAEDAHHALGVLVHFYADLVDADPVDVLRLFLDHVAGEVAPEPAPPAPVGPTLTDLEAGYDVDVARFASGTMVRVRFGSEDYDEEAEFVFASLCVLARRYGELTGYPATDVLQPLAENLDPNPSARPATPLDGRPAVPVLNPVDAYVKATDAGDVVGQLVAHAAMCDQAEDRCGFCREVVDVEGPEGEALRRLHDDGLCRPSVHGSRIAAAGELLRAAEALEGPAWSAALAEYLRVVGYQVGDRVAIGTDPRFVIVGTVVGVLARNAGYLVRPAGGSPVAIRPDELRPIVADLLASAGTVVDAAPVAGGAS